MSKAAEPISSRKVNIESAIDRSSFQLPVFVALKVDGGEEQVDKTFATAREVFSRIFSILLDRSRQGIAVAKVEDLVPETATVKNSCNTEYVLVVRGRAIFWFSSPAAKRAAGRRLLLEHARELAEAEQAPFYKLSTPARRRWAALTTAMLLLAAAIIAFATFMSRQRNSFRRQMSPQTTERNHANSIGSGPNTLPAQDASLDTFGHPDTVLASRAGVSSHSASLLHAAEQITIKRSLESDPDKQPEIARIIRFQLNATGRVSPIAKPTVSSLPPQHLDAARSSLHVAAGNPALR